MSAQDLLRGRVTATPTIYAYEHIDYSAHKGWLKVGYTTRTAEIRVREQNQTSHVKFKIVLERPAMRKDGPRLMTDLSETFSKRIIFPIRKGNGAYAV